ncbi:unnamed protein product [Symbiodinium sp. CCMP2592]|nr:unnamed protein product [Symbiodinium sp. CCMP2592]
MKGFKSTLDVCTQNDHLAACLKDLDRVLQGRKGRSFLEACETLTKERSGSIPQDKVAEAVQCWISFFREHKTQLTTLLPKLATSASVLYLGCMQGLEAATMCNALTNWAQKVPMTTGNQESLGHWQTAPKDVERLKAFMIAALQQRHTEGAAWLRQNGMGGDSDEEAATWGVPDTGKARARSSSSGTTDSAARRKKKAAKKEKKRAKEDAKRSKAAAAAESGPKADVKESSKKKSEGPLADVRSSSTSSSSSGSSRGRRPPKLPRGRHFWVLPGGDRECTGPGDGVCTMAADGSGRPGMADETGLCVFCSPERLREVLAIRDGRLLTRALSQLREPHLSLALRKVEAQTDTETVAKWRLRVERSQWRQNPARARRGPRGKYGKNKASRKRASRSERKARRARKRPAAAEAWGVCNSADRPAGRDGTSDDRIEEAS